MQIDTELKEVKSAFDDIAKEPPKDAPEGAVETGGGDSAATAAADETPPETDDSMDQLKAAFDRRDDAVEGPDEPAAEEQMAADSTTKPETDRG